MTVEVRDETGTNGALATTVTDTLTAAIPVIEKVTELPLPRCTFRLVTPRVWRSEVRAYVRRSLQGAMDISPPTLEDARQAGRTQKRWRSKVRWRWPLMNGMTITTLDGVPETLICPRALHHTGLTKTFSGLPRFVIHEGVHQAQIHYSAGRVVPPRLSPRPDPTEDRMVDALAEGHADWAEILVTYHLSGQQFPQEETARTSLHTPIRQGLLYARNRTAVRWEQARHGTTPPPPASRDELRAYLLRRSQPAHPVGPEFMFVQETMPPSCGDLWNFVWTNRDLVPTRAEFEDPPMWRQRVGL